MRRLTLSLAAGLAMAVAVPAFGQDMTPAGLWLTETETNYVRIGPCSDNPDTICGAIEKTNDPDWRDTENPDESMQDRGYVGLPLFWSFAKSADDPNVWEGGDSQAYSPTKGMYADEAEIEMIDANTLEFSGCKVIAFIPICQGQTWTRAE